jgi:hypothetical protein
MVEPGMYFLRASFPEVSRPYILVERALEKGNFTYFLRGTK